MYIVPIGLVVLITPHEKLTDGFIVFIKKLFDISNNFIYICVKENLSIFNFFQF